MSASVPFDPPIEGPREGREGDGTGVSPFSENPVLIFWETTKACLLACRHCRARAQRTPLPGELSTDEALTWLRAATRFGPPAPVVVFTGGDLLMRADIFDLLDAARAYGLKTAVSPSATPLLTSASLRRFKAAGVSAMSLSLDGAASFHDGLRGVEGTYLQTIRAIREGRGAGLQVQVNTVVMRENADTLADLAAVLLEEGVSAWEVFFLIRTGRARRMEPLAPDEGADVLRFLLEASRRRLLVRPIEAPFVRRMIREADAGGALFRRLRDRLEALAGTPPEGAAARMGRTGTLDGDGTVFIGYDGTIFPGGLLPIPLGNVREDDIVDLYRNHPLLQAIRQRRLAGVCGRCEARSFCGGSRARAFAETGDPLGSDPACPWGDDPGREDAWGGRLKAQVDRRRPPRVEGRRSG